MNRRKFFKFLGVSAATAAVAPVVLAEQESELARITKMKTELKMLHIGKHIDWTETFKKIEDEHRASIDAMLCDPEPKPVCFYIGDSPNSGPVDSYIWKNPDDSESGGKQ